MALATLLARAGLGQTPPAGPGTGGLFDDMPIVEAASLHAQSLQDAPANVTIIGEDDIRKYGYRTLADALGGARGFYVTSDHAYTYVGLRGFSLPGDYNTRFLVMVDGHVMTDIVLNENGFYGQDFGIDMDLVKRIEIVRGPASALYGSNGILCTINVVTKAPVEVPAARVSVETGSFGEKKVQAASSVDLGRGANLLVSASVFNNSGQTLYYPEFDTQHTGNGWARDVDGERGYHAFTNLTWRNWSFIANLSTRVKNVPVVPWTATLFADRGTKIEDDRDFAEVRYERDLDAVNRIQFRAYYDHYRGYGRYSYPPEDASGILDERDTLLGDWAGSQVVFRRQTRRWGTFTVGTELIGEVRNLQTTEIVSPIQELVGYIDAPDLRGGIFDQQELDLSRRWKVDLGLRYDRSRLHGGALSPRAALLFRQSPATVWKFLWGRAFRNPSAVEAYWTDTTGSMIPNPGLRQEHADTWEASFERSLRRHLNFVVTAYLYELRDMIQAMPVDTEGWVYQYRNATRSRAAGAEFELNGPLWRRLEGVISFAAQNAVYTGSDTGLPNSPARIAKLRLSTPLWRKLSLATAWQYVSARQTLSGFSLPGVPLGEIHISTVELTPAFDLQFGVRNLLDRRYDDPAGGTMIIDRVRADGRSVYLKVTWHTRG